MPKSDKTAANAAAENALNAAQVLFSMDPVHMPHATLFCLSREQFLKDAEKFSAGWVRRRQDATRAALELASQIASEGVNNPAAVMKAMNDWQTHSLERLAADARDYTEMMAHCVGNLALADAKAAEKAAKKARKAAKAKKKKKKKKK